MNRRRRRSLKLWLRDILIAFNMKDKEQFEIESFARWQNTRNNAYGFKKGDISGKTRARPFDGGVY